MAEKLRAELEILTAKAEKDLKRLDRSLAGVERRITSIGGKGGKSLKPLGEGLSAATVNANEFEKSMAAANARVIAFGASAGLIIQVQRALKETVRATIEVEKSLTDINVVLGASSKQLASFGDRLFKVAAQTGQSFKTIAVGATELTRQGLGTEKTLKRLSDAMILSRLTGMGAEEAVSSLTAAVNSFNKAGITSAQVINKMAKVDQAFAVSSDDLAKAISRVGSSAVDAGVSMDELLAITTAVQQRTARGGAVIGNAFKTIFTRIGRTDVQKKLTDIGVATRDMQGQMLPATKVLQNLSKQFQTLSQTQQNQIAESVAGVFQVNILRAALGDLSSKYGIYNRALRDSASATNEAYLKNEQLNQTLSALVNKTLANLTKAGAAIGGATLKPAIENVLGLVNDAIGAFGEGGRFEKFGEGIGKDLMKGLGNFISGPGLILATAGIAKLGYTFVKFAADALKGFADIGRQAANRKALEAQITAELQRQPNIIKQIERGELSAANAAKDMLAAMKASNLEATKLAATTSRISASMIGMGGLRRPGRAQGFIPNFADPNAERASAAMGGYKAGAIKNINIPGQGSVMYNSAETVKRFPGMQQPAIMPPQGSRAGSNYQKAFGAAHGFDPYAASGLVPNFASASAIFAKGMAKISAGKTVGLNTQIEVLRNKGPEGIGYARQLESELKASRMTKKAGAGSVRTGENRGVISETFNSLGTIGLLGLSGGRRNASASTSLAQIAKFRERSGMSLDELANYRVTFDTMQARSIDELKHGFSKTEFSSEISRVLTDPVSKLSHKLFNKALGNDNDVSIKDLKSKFSQNTQLLPPGAEGSIFEAAINLGLLTTKTSTKAKARAFDQSAEGAQKPFDFEEIGPAKPDFKKIFRFDKSLVYADAKRTIDNNSLRSLIHKSYNRGIAGLPFTELLTGGAKVAKASGKRGRALGHVPNFSPLGDAITRERAAGVPVSAIRVGSSPALRSSGNPGGVGVYNTIDEPGGLGQGISRSRSMGINPKSHGVPNFTSTVSPLPPGTVLGPGGAPVNTPGGIILADSITELSRRTVENTRAVTSSTEAMKPTLRERAMGRIANFRGGSALGSGMAGSIGYMAAPMVGNYLGADQGGVQGAVSGATIGGMLAPSLIGLAGILGAPVTGGMSLALTAAAVGAGGYAGYQMGKEDPADAAAREERERIKALVGEQKDFGNALSALIGQIRQLQDSTNMTPDMRRGAIKGLQVTKQRALITGKQAGFDADEIEKIYDQALMGNTGGAEALEARVIQALTSSKRLQNLAGIREQLGAAMKGRGMQDEVDAVKAARTNLENFIGGGKHPRAGSTGRDADLIPRVTEELRNELRKAEAKLEKFDLGRGKEGEELFKMFERLLAEPGKKGLTPRSSLMRGAFDKMPNIPFQTAGGFDRKVKMALDSLVKTEEISQDFVDFIFELPEVLRAPFMEVIALRTEKATYTKGEQDFINRRQKNFIDLTELNKTYIRGLLDESIQLQKAKQAIQNALKVDLLKLGSERTILNAQAKSGINLATIRGGDRAGLVAARESIRSTVEGSFDITRRESLKRQQAAVKTAKNDLSQKALSKLAGAVGMGKADFQAFQPTEVPGFFGQFAEDFPTSFDAPKTIAAAKARDEINKIKEAPEDAEKYVNFLKERIVNLQAITGSLGSQEQDAIKDYITSLNNTISKVNAEAGVREIIPEQIKEAIRVQEALNDIQKEELEARKRFQKNAYINALNDRQLMADTTVEGLTELRASGVGITGAQIAAAKQEARRATIARGERVNSGQGFVESFRFNSADAALAMDDAMTELGTSIKDSTKTAIQDIASGASSFKEAFAGIMASLADNIANRSIDMGVDSLFNFLVPKKSKGGYIPRGYNQGGVVTGGSGVRDDVMTFMQGGEYVIKKSAAQKIGYSTLNSINSYASGGRARVSLAKDFLYTGDDPTRPTGGGFKVSRNLSSAALFRDTDPQTDRIFGGQRTLTSYLEYRRAEQARRDAAIQRVKDQKKARRNKAYIGAAINIGMGALAHHAANKPPTGAEGGGIPDTLVDPTLQGPRRADGSYNRGGSPALVMGGEYIMSPQTTAKYGTGFMSELNRGRLPGYQNGGMVGGGGGASSAITTNNVNLAINIDKSGQTSVEAQSTSGQGENQERQDKSEVEKQKQMGEAIRGVVLKEIERQQRPGGLLRDGASYAGGRRP